MVLGRGLIRLPEAIALAFVAKVDPMVGVFDAVIVCLVTSLLGGRPGMISGATAAMAVVMFEVRRTGVTR